MHHGKGMKFVDGQKYYCMYNFTEKSTEYVCQGILYLFLPKLVYGQTMSSRVLCCFLELILFFLYTCIHFKVTGISRLLSIRRLSMTTSHPPLLPWPTLSQCFMSATWNTQRRCQLCWNSCRGKSTVTVKNIVFYSFYQIKQLRWPLGGNFVQFCYWAKPGLLCPGIYKYLSI